MTVMTRLTVLLVAVALQGCGPTGFNGSCDERSTAEKKCTEYSDVGVLLQSSYSSGCKITGIWSATEHCSRTNVVGGCQSKLSDNAGGTMIIWYYPGFGPSGMDDLTTLQTLYCKDPGETVVPP